jgi:hypothetical protein
VSLADYSDQLARFALGVLHWTEEQTLNADMNAIAMASEGQWEFMLEVLETGGFIKREQKAEVPPVRTGTGQTLSPQLFRALFDRKR